MNEEQLRKVAEQGGFIAALDQSGGSTPQTLLNYGIEADAYSGEAEQFDLIHRMRARVVSSPSFGADRILGVILFEMTMDREIEGLRSGKYLWEVKSIVPFLKVDKGLAEEANGVQLMNPMPGLDEVLARARDEAIFGTKMRSVVKLADPSGVNAVVDQQFEIGRQILATRLVPILEPEVDLNSPEKAEAEALLKDAILRNLENIDNNKQVMLKLTLPDEDNFYADLIEHPGVLKVVALSGGYSRREANAKLARNAGMVASFSRALLEGLSVQQSDEEFNAVLDEAIAGIFEASCT